jgi:hypothetical protein
MLFCIAMKKVADKLLAYRGISPVEDEDESEDVIKRPGEQLCVLSVEVQDATVGYMNK